MDLNDAVKQFEAVEANLVKLEQLWKQIEKLLPSLDEVQVGDQEQYVRAQRSFEHIAKPMPKVDGLELKICLAHPDEIFRMKVETLEIGEFTDRVALDSDLRRQGEVLGEYRFRMDGKRRALARQAVEPLCAGIEAILTNLRPIAANLKDNEAMPPELWEELKSLYKSIDALLGNSLGRASRWGDMARHIGFGVRHDYDDIINHDWPDIRQWLERALYGETDPLPVSVADIGDLVRTKPTGPVSTELNWSALTPEDFERLIFNLIDRTSGYVNPQWLTHTNAPDRGRDLSVERVMQDNLTGSRRSRIILACKHTDSVNLTTVAALKEQMKLWEPPRVDELIVVTTGRFTTDAIEYIEKHNRGAEAMRVEMWPNSQLERLLANRPELIADFRLRK